MLFKFHHFKSESPFFKNYTPIHNHHYWTVYLLLQYYQYSQLKLIKQRGPVSLTQDTIMKKIDPIIPSFVGLPKKRSWHVYTEKEDI